MEDLPEAALRIVVRQMSSTPSRIHWNSFVDHADALAAVQLKCSLSSVARSLFTTVSVGDNFRPVREGNLHFPNKLLALLQWIEASGESMTALKLASAMQVTDPSYHEPVLIALKTKCPALRSLSISEMFQNPLAGELLHALEGEIHTIVVNRRQALTLAETGRGIRHLTLTGEPTNMSDLVRVVGPTLESFEIHFRYAGLVPGYTGMVPGMLPGMLENVFCPKLTRIVFKDVAREDFSAYADFLIAHALKLRFAHVGRMSKEFCAKVVSSCSEMRCEVQVDEDDAVDVFSVLGRSIQNLVWGSTHELTVGTEACCNIEAIELFVHADRAADTIDALLRAHQPRLTSFKLLVVSEGNIDDALRALSDRASTLLHFEFNGFMRSLTSFDEFGRRASRLVTAKLNFRDAEIYCGNGTSFALDQTLEYEAGIQSVVGSFVSCPDLRQLTIPGWGRSNPNRIEAIANLCYRARRKKRHGLIVEILGLGY